MLAGNPMRATSSADPPRQAQSSKGTHIRNKDGTKLITVPTRKVSNSDSTNSSNNSNNIAPSAPPPPPPAAQNSMSMDYSNSASSNNVGGRKKKKKKGKQQQQVQNQLASGSGNHYTEYYEDDLAYNHNNGPASPQEEVHRYMEDIRASMAEYEDPPPDLVDPDEDEEYYSGPTYDNDNDDDNDSYAPSQTAPTPLPGKKKNKKKKKRGGNVQDSFQNAVVAGGSNRRKGGKDRIWNTSTSEERERIKDFWLSLGEEERRSLVKVEKEAVLRKMKEQQKHSCSCSVCGRKRTAIEEELEVLYDAYYEELEQYANQQQNPKYAAQIPHSPSPGAYSASRIPPPPPPPGPPPNHHHRHHHHLLHHANHRVEEIDDDEFEEEDDEEYDDEEEEEDVPDDNLPENDPTPDFFNFGNSLTVQGGILTVADDLLKNDGKKFIEMMEQLAERRMQREEEANAVAAGHTMNMSVGQGHIPHTHTQPQEYEDEEEYEEDEEEDEEEYEEDEEDEPDTMTEEQRMEEGRRMFQIFAARMFEQRVLTAYREKVARERQDKLLEELDEEAQLRIQREEKKAKEKERKKEKKRLQKLAREEERLKKEAEKAAEEARLRAIEEKKAEENRKRKEEQRLKRDAEKKAVEEERRKKEEERKKRLEEEREREAERERKRKEHQERERRKREEVAKKAKEEKEARDKEARERRERDERERKERAKKREAIDRENARKEEEERSKAEALAAATAAAKRPPPVSVPVSTPQVSQHPPGGFSSPHLTPALPKQPVGHSPARPRNTSQQGSIQGSVASSPKTPQAVPRVGSSASPSTPILQHNIPGPIIPPNKTFQFPTHMPHMAPTSPLPHHIAPPPGAPSPEGFPVSPIGVGNPMNPFLPGLQRGPSFPNGMPMYSPAQMPLSAASQYRGFAAPNGMPMQVPATPGMRPLPQQGRGIFIGEVAPGMPPQLPPGVPLVAPGSPFVSNRAEPVPIPGNHSHSRALSGSFDPIQRPTPIQRPSSVAPPKNLDDNRNSIDELSNVMGSRALLEDDDEGHLTQNQSPNRRTSGVGFSPLPTRAVPFFDSRVDGLNIPVPSWTNPAPLGTISNSLPNTWASGAGWSDTDAARSTFNRRRINRVDHIRALACKKCRELGGENNNFVEVSTLLRAMEQVSHPDMQILMKDLAEILDIEGDELNGGGILAVTHDTDGRTLVRFEGRELLGVDGTPLHQAPGAPTGSGFHGVPSEIGSPNAGNASPFKPVPPPGMMVSPNPSGF